MDLTNLGAVIGSFILGIGAVATFLHRVLPLLKKYLALANDTIFFLNYLALAIDDEKLSEDEWTNIKANALKLKADWVAINTK